MKEREKSGRKKEMKLGESEEGSLGQLLTCHSLGFMLLVIPNLVMLVFKLLCGL